MACQFSFVLEIEPLRFLQMAQATFAEASGEFEGDASAGWFRLPSPIGQIAGSYTLNAAGVLTVHVEKKPFLVSCQRIQSALGKYLNGYSKHGKYSSNL